MDGDTVDDFIMIDSIIQNELRTAPTPTDLQHWADGYLPEVGINGWDSGALDFPVVGDGNYSIWNQWKPGGRGAIPTNIVIGTDFVLDINMEGFDDTAVRCCIEKNLCEGRDPSFVIPSTGTRCDTTFNCRVSGSPVCTN